MRSTLQKLSDWLLKRFPRGIMPVVPLMIILAALVGLIGGFCAVFFSALIDSITDWSIFSILRQPTLTVWHWIALCCVPAAGLLVVSWFTRTFAPEAQGNGVPEVIAAVARHDGIIRPRVSIAKIFASGLCIGTGGSIGREGPIVQIGAALGSVGGQLFQLSPRNIKVLVAAGAATGISATFNAPLAGVIFASEIILGNFAVESLTPIVVASVVADVIQQRFGEHGLHSAYTQLNYSFEGAWLQFPTHIVLGLLCGLIAVWFTKLLYWTEDWSFKWLPRWWQRSLIFGLILGLSGVIYGYYLPPPAISPWASNQIEEVGKPLPSLFGVGEGTVDHALHIENAANPPSVSEKEIPPDKTKMLRLEPDQMLAQFWWLLPLVFLKPIMTSITLAGGGSGGIFAPSLFIGATLGAAFGLLCNYFVPGLSADPGVYAVVGMGAVVAGTTHGLLSAILIVYEMTNDYRIILPIMAAAGLSSIVAGLIDPESIYLKKLSRRGESIARGHDMFRMEHITVRDVMIRTFPTVRFSDTVPEIVRVAQANPDIESLPVMDDAGRLQGIIRPEDLHRVLDSDIEPHLINAGDITMYTPVAVSPSANLLEALRDFGSRDLDALPVEEGRGEKRRLVGLLRRSDVMRRYREELLSI